jgi:hypothetical protein
MLAQQEHSPNSTVEWWQCWFEPATNIINNSKTTTETTTLPPPLIPIAATAETMKGETVGSWEQQQWQLEV